MNHPLAEFLPILRLLNSFYVDPDEANIVFFPDAEFFSLFGEVQRRLTTHRRQYGIYIILFKNLFDAFYVQWQEIDPVCHHRVGHDGGGVAVDQDHFYAFFP